MVDFFSQMVSGNPALIEFIAVCKAALAGFIGF